MTDHFDTITGQQAADLGPDVTVRFRSDLFPDAESPPRSCGRGLFVNGPSPAYAVLPGVQDGNDELDVVRRAITQLNAQGASEHSAWLAEQGLPEHDWEVEA